MAYHPHAARNHGNGHSGPVAPRHDGGSLLPSGAWIFRIAMFLTLIFFILPAMFA